MAHSNDIYYYRPDLPEVDTAKVFEITHVNGKLAVKNNNIACLFSNLTPDQFDKLYNDFNRHLNLDFAPVTLNNKTYQLTDAEQKKLTEKIITSWIYFYTINNLAVEVKRSDFTHPYMVDYVLSVLDKKCGTDTREALALGAKILRQRLADYTNAVKGRRRYYDR